MTERDDTLEEIASYIDDSKEAAQRMGKHPLVAALEVMAEEVRSRKSKPSSVSEIEQKVTKRAQVGNTVFHPGVPLRLLIERAEREYAYQQEPEQQAERKERLEVFLQDLHKGPTSDPYNPDPNAPKEYPGE